jgi:hypothetical protein
VSAANQRMPGTSRLARGVFTICNPRAKCCECETRPPVYGEPTCNDPRCIASFYLAMFRDLDGEEA